jgi:arylsulfatase
MTVTKSSIRYRVSLYTCAAALAACSLVAGLESAQAQAQNQKPNIILILSDDFGYGDSGPYGGGENRGMPTPSLDRLAAVGMYFLWF